MQKLKSLLEKSRKKVKEKKKGLTEKDMHYNLLIKSGADEALKHIINEKYIMVAELGEGAYAKVYRAKIRSTG